MDLLTTFAADDDSKAYAHLGLVFAWQNFWSGLTIYA